MQSFHPPRRTLMGPGPSDINPRVTDALAKDTLGHLDPQFIVLMDQIKEMLQYAFQTKNKMTFPVSAPGSAGMECCFVNLVEPGDKVAIAQNGVFGMRMKENAERCGANPVMIEQTWGEPVNPDLVEETLKSNPHAKIFAFVHAETSTGALSDAETLCKIARDNDCLVLVDAVTSLGGSPLKVDEWGIDAIYSGTQKCLSCVPGISPVSFSERALDTIKNRKTKVQSWFLDVSLLMTYWGGEAKRAYHHTAPVNAMYALHEALVILQEEGLEAAWKRHTRNHNALKAGFEAMGLSFIVEEGSRLPQLNSVSVPEGVDEAAVRSALLNEYSLEIGAGLGAMAGKIWRVGLMGHASNPKNVLLCLGAMDTILSGMNAAINSGVAVAKARDYYAANQE
ncbi:MAG TPA: alanine--glyoxylate aminotransferase family protein [Candidatus Hydrogenedentes bacterium]|nr:alanine--glyoxylate aminotransferase family protein [Candidatus Hydrogenedentota bacterium]